MTSENAAWMIAGAGWAVALLALFLAFLFRGDWAQMWRYAWLLRRTGHEVPSSVARAVTDQVRPKQSPEREAPLVAPLSEPVVDPKLVILSDAVLRKIAETGEEWHRDELATAARTLLAQGASEVEVLDELSRLMEEGD